MEAIEIKEGTWKYKLLTELGGLSKWDFKYGELDSCKINRALFKAGSIASIIGVVSLAAFGFMVYAIGDVLAWVTCMIIAGMWIEPSQVAAPVFVLTCMAAAVAILYFSFKGVQLGVQKVGKAVGEKTMGTELYQSWKHKYCKPVKFILENGREFKPEWER